jgi:hypothetical protein
MNITIDTKDNAAPAVARLAAKLGDRTSLHKAIAAGVLIPVQKQLRANAQSNKNKFGARSSFWNRMLSSTIAIGTGDAATVRMPPEMGLRVHGGTVKPKAAKMLAIPAVKEAYGKSPRDFDDLRWAPYGQGALVQREQTRLTKSGGKGRTIGGRIFFWLVKSATITGNRDLIPSDATILEAVRAKIASYTRAEATA